LIDDTDTMDMQTRSITLLIERILKQDSIE